MVRSIEQNIEIYYKKGVYVYYLSSFNLTSNFLDQKKLYYNTINDQTKRHCIITILKDAISNNFDRITIFRNDLIFTSNINKIFQLTNTSKLIYIGGDSMVIYKPVYRSILTIYENNNSYNHAVTQVNKIIKNSKLQYCMSVDNTTNLYKNLHLIYDIEFRSYITRQYYINSNLDIYLYSNRSSNYYDRYFTNNYIDYNYSNNDSKIIITKVRNKPILWIGSNTSIHKNFWGTLYELLLDLKVPIIIGKGLDDSITGIIIPPGYHNYENILNDSITLGEYLLLCDLQNNNLEGLSKISVDNNIIYKNYYLSNSINNIITVIMPVYNSQDTIIDTINSIFNQTYHHFKLIIVDDGSKDQTVERIKLYDKYNEIRLIELNDNQGCYPARNIAISETDSEIIALHDADDISFDVRLERQIEAMISMNVDMVLCKSLKSDTVKFTSLKSSDIMWEMNRDFFKRRFWLWEQYQIYFQLTPLMCKKSLFKKYGDYRTDMKASMDGEFIARVLYLNNGINPIDNYLYKWLQSNQYLEGTYYGIDELLYTSTKMTDKNITTIYKDTRGDMIQKWIKEIIN